MKKLFTVCLLLAGLNLFSLTAYGEDEINLPDPQRLVNTYKAVSTAVTTFNLHQQQNQELSKIEQEIVAWFSNQKIMDSLSQDLNNVHWNPLQPHAMREGVKALSNNPFVKDLTLLFLQNQTDFSLEQIDLEHAKGWIAQKLIETIIKTEKKSNR